MRHGRGMRRWWRLCALTVAFGASAPALAQAGVLPATCAQLEAADATATDGPQVLGISGREVEIYCADMATASPTEYLTLPTGPAGNYSEVNVSWHGDYLTPPDDDFGLRTSYEKVRLDPATLRLDVTDKRFATTASTLPAFYDVAPANYGIASTGSSVDRPDPVRGRGRIDLRGTPFAITSGFVTTNDLVWNANTPDDASATLSNANQVAKLVGGSWRGAIRTADPGFVQLELLPATTAPATDTVVSADRVRRAIWVAGEGIRIAQDAAGLRSLVQERLLQELYRQQPDLPAGDATAIVTKVDTAMKSGPTDRDLVTLSFNERILALLAAAQSKVAASGGFPGLDATRAQALAAALPRVADSAMTESDRAGEPTAMFSATTDKSASLASGGFAATKVLVDSFELGRTDTAFRTARDSLWGNGTSMTAGAPQLAAAYPALRSGEMTVLLHDLKETGTVSVSVLQALREGVAATNRITDLLDTATADTQVVDDACVHPASTDCRAELDAQAAAVQSRAVKFESARAISVFNAQLIFGRDPAIAGAQQAMVNASADFAKATDAYVAAVKAEQEKAKKFGIAKIVGGILAIGAGAYTSQAGVAFAGVTSIIGGAGDMTADDDKGKAVQDELKAISAQVKASTDLLNSRMGEINTALQTQYAAIQTNTDQLAAVLDHLSGQQAQLQSIGGALGQVATKIDTLSSQLVELFSASTSNQLVLDANDYTNRLRRTGEPLSTAELGKGANALATAAISTASSPTVSTSPPAGAFTIDETLAQLARPLDSNLNYLLRLPAERGWTTAPLMADAAPNPSYWSGAVRAYAQLLLENRSRVTPAYRDQLAAAQAVGSRLADALAKLSVKDHDGGQTGNRVFDGALADLQATADAPGGGSADQPSLEAALDAEVTRYMGALPSPADGLPIGVDPFAATDSAATTTDFSFTTADVPSCEASGKAIAMTSLVKSHAPNLAITAQRLGLVKLSVCYHARFLTAYGPSAGSSMVGLYCTFCSSSTADAFDVYTEKLDATGQLTGSDSRVGAQLEYSWTPRTGGAATRIAIAPVSDANYNPDGYGFETDFNGFTVGCGTGSGRNVYDVMVANYGSGGCGNLDDVIAQRVAYEAGYPSYPLPQSTFWVGTTNATRDAAAAGVRGLVDGPVEQLPLDANPAELTLSSLRQRVFDDLLKAADDASSPVYQAARRVEGARELIRSYVQLGLPEALAADDGLRSTIEGADLPVGTRDELKGVLQRARSNPPVDHSSPTTAVPTMYGAFVSDVVAGRNAFADAIAPHIGATDDLSAENPVVGPTVDRLTLARGVLAEPAPIGPAPTITVPVAGATYAQGDPVKVAWSCPAGRDATDVTCTAPARNGEPLDTSAAGAKTFKVTATDRDGFAISRTVSYTVKAQAVPAPAISLPSPSPTPSPGDGPTASRRIALTRLSLAARAFSRTKGTRLSFRLSRAAKVKVTLLRRVGRKKLAAGRTTLKGHSGRNRITFGRGLKPGIYLVTLVAGSGATASKPHALTFTVRR